MTLTNIRILTVNVSWINFVNVEIIAQNRAKLEQETFGGVRSF